MSTIAQGSNNGTFQGYASHFDQRVTDNAAYVPVFRRWQLLTDGTDAVSIVTWPGTPEANIVGDIGSLGLDSSTGAIYIKTTDTVNTGWVLIGPSTGTISSVDVDAATGPGTDPVLPNGAGQISLLGSNPVAQAVPVRTHSLVAANRIDVEVQMSSAQAVSTATANGLCHFDSADFTVDASGFVSAISGTSPWLDIAAGALANHTGYFATAAAVFTLPAGVANGDMVEIVDFIGGGVVVTAQGGDVIRVGNTTSAANGTATSTLIGDGLRLVFRATGQVWVCVPGASGNWLVV